MSRSDHGSSAHLTSPYSRPGSKASSVDQDSLAHMKPRSMATLNILFLGETDIGGSSVIDLIAGPRKRKKIPRRAGRRTPGDDLRSITLGSKIFKLHASPTNDTISPVALREGIQSTLTNLRRNGSIHLLVYCINALHSTLSFHEIHRIITSNSASSPRIPAVAVITGVFDVAQQENWWSSNKVALADQGLHFDDHAFIRMMTLGDQSPTGNHVSENRHVLHALILQNCAYALGSGADSEFQRMAPYKHRSIGNSFQSLVTLARKPPSHISTSSKAIDVILLGEIGVGKSSLINLITKEKIAGVSSDTIACTQTSTKYTFEEKGRTFHLYDTPGLVDPRMGVKSFVDPIDIIQKLIRSLGNGNGPDLLLFCIDNSKPTVALQRNYRLFYKIICEGKIPFALAITKLEKGQGVDQWWRKHEATIREYGIDCSGHIGIGREKRHLDPNLDPERQLRESLLSFLVTCTDREKYRTSSPFSPVVHMIGLVTSFLRSQVSTLEGTLMNQCGLEEQSARELANRIVSSKQPYSNRMRT